MRKYFSLTSVLLKNNINSVGKNGKKGKGLFLYIFIILCFIPMSLGLYTFFDTTISGFQTFDQSGSILALGFALASLLIFVFSLFLIPAVFYFSKDLEHLLPLPIKPQIILLSKFTVVLLYEYIIALLLLVPLFVAYVRHVDVNILYYLLAFIIFITIPIFPLILSSIIAMLLMSFVPFFKNRDRFNLFIGLFTIVFGFGLSFYLQTNETQSSQALVSLLKDGNNSLIKAFSFAFPNIPFAAKALVNTDILNIAIYLLINIIAVAVLLTFGKFIYFKGAIGINETTSSRKALSNEQMSKVNRKHNIVLTYMMKEIKLIFRNPTYFIQCVVAAFLLPIVIIVFSFAGHINLSALHITTFTMADFPTLFPYCLLAGFAFGIFMASSAPISSTSISREGAHATFMKIIPVSLSDQIKAKVLSGLCITIIPIILFIIVGCIIVPEFPILCYIIIFIASLITLVFYNYLAITLDVAHPKLVWELEIAAVKQNMNNVVCMFGGWLLTALIIVGMFFIPSSFILPIAIIVCVISIVGTIVLMKNMEKIATRMFKNI